MFFTGPAPKSVEYGKFPTKKVKVGVKPLIMLSHSSTLTFLVGNLLSSTLRTFWAGLVKKPSCISDTFYIHFVYILYILYYIFCLVPHCPNPPHSHKPPNTLIDLLMLTFDLKNLGFPQVCAVFYNEWI